MDSNEFSLPTGSGIREQSFPQLVQKAKKVLSASLQSPLVPAPADNDINIEQDPVADPIADPVASAGFPTGLALGANPLPVANVIDSTAEQHAEVFQGFLHDQISTNMWLGQNARLTLANKLDKQAGIDSVIMLKSQNPERAPEFLGLQIYFRGTKIAETMQAIKERVANDTLTPITTFRVAGQHIRIPQIVIGASNVHRQEALDLWAQNNAELLREHPLKLLLLAQIRLQLQAYQTFAIKSRVTDTAQRYARALALIDECMAGITPTSYNSATMQYINSDEVMWHVIINLIRVFGYEGEDFARFFRR